MISNLDEAQIEALLAVRHTGHIGCIANGRPYVVPVTYVYEGGAIYGHTSEGLKAQAMRASPLVCFEVEDIRDMRNWKSVIAWGQFEELTGKLADDAMNLMMTKLAPDATSETFFAPNTYAKDYRARGIRPPPMRGVAYRIPLTEKTGRCELRPAPQGAEEAPGGIPLL